MATEASTLNVFLDYVDIEGCSLAFYDYIEIYQGFRRGLKLKAKVCSDTINSFNVSGDVTIRFKSDSVVQKSGFRIIVSAMEG